MSAHDELTRWYDQPAQIAELLRWLDERCEIATVADAIDVIEEPWHYEEEYTRMLAERAVVA